MTLRMCEVLCKIQDFTYKNLTQMVAGGEIFVAQMECDIFQS